MTSEAGELQGALAAGARAQHTEGDLQASRESFERAYRLAERADDGPSMALAALGLAGLWVRECRTVTGAVLLEERLAHVLTRLDVRDPLALRIRVGWPGSRTTSGASTRPSWPCSTRPGRPPVPSRWPRR